MAASFFGARYRHRHPPGSTEPLVQILSTGRCFDDASLWRYWIGPGDLQTSFRIDGRENLGRERRWQGSDISLYNIGKRCRRDGAPFVAEPATAAFRPALTRRRG